MRILRIAIAAALAAGSIAGGLVLSATPASADVPAIPIQYVSQYFWGGTNTVAVSGTVSCPSGSRVVSSGASTTGRYGNLVGIAPDINSFTSATATAFTQEYLAITIGCLPSAALSEVTTRTITLPYGKGFRHGVVYCPAGMRAFGGGGYMVRPFGVPSLGSSNMTSNAVSADGTGWTYAAVSGETNTAPVITTQCAPLRGSYVSTNSVPTRADIVNVNVFAPCGAGYTALSGGVYLSRPDGNEVQGGVVDYSVPASGNRWYVNGRSFTAPGSDKLVALVQCIR